jgi:hypothetical protein
MRRRDRIREPKEGVMFKIRTALIGTAAAIALAAMPMSGASARGFHHGPGLFFPLAIAGAVGIAAATLLTAPFAIAAAPFQGAPGYYPPPAPAYYPPPPPAYAYPPQAYGYPPGYYYGPR